MQTNTTGSSGGTDIRTTFDLDRVYEKAKNLMKPKKVTGDRSIEIPKDQYNNIQPILEHSATNLSMKNEGETWNIQFDSSEEVYDKILGSVSRKHVA